MAELIKALPWPLFAATPGGQILDVNEAGLALLDATQGSGFGRQLRDFAAETPVDQPIAGPGPLRRNRQDLTAGRLALRLHRLPPRVASLFGRDCVLIGVERRTVNPLTEAALRERFQLTRQQARVAAHLARGKRAEDIACELNLSIHTVHRHTEAVLLKIGVRSRAELIYRVLGEQLDWDELTST